MSEVEVLREVDPSARVSSDAAIGSRCVIGPAVTIGPGTVLGDRVTVVGHTTIGSGNDIEDGCVLGVRPQDRKFAGSPTLLIIGHRNHFGRNVTAHIGTEVGGYLTRVGDDNDLQASSHIAHDCYIDDRTTLEPYVMLAGHIHVCTGAVLGEWSGAHHFVTVGRHARVGPYTPARRDVPPFTDFCGHKDDFTPAVKGVHEAGIAAADLSEEEEKDLRRALAELFDEETALQTKIEQLVTLGVEGEVEHLCEFCQQSLQGVFGRYRERLRGQIPPEAEKYLTPEQMAEARRAIL